MKKDLIIKIAVTVSVLIMFVVNALANILPINGITTGAVSDGISIFFVPAGYVFSIWGLIYAGLVVYLVSMWRNFTKQDKEISLWVIISSLANSVWIFMWHYNFIYISILFMLIILASLIAIYIILHKQKVSQVKRTPFNIYLGWISVATVANIAGALFLANWNGFGISGEIWSAIMILVATALALIMLWKKTVTYTLVILWAVIGIMVKFTGVSNIVTIVALVATLAILATIGTQLYLKGKD